MNCKNLIELIEDHLIALHEAINFNYYNLSLDEKEKIFKCVVKNLYKFRDEFTSDFLNDLLPIVKRMIYIKAEFHEELYDEDSIDILSQYFIECNPLFLQTDIYENYIVPVQNNFCEEIHLSIPKKYLSDPNWEEKYKKALEQEKKQKDEKKYELELQQYLNLKKKFESK